MLVYKLVHFTCTADQVHWVSCCSVCRVDVVITPIKSTLLGQGAVAYPIVLGDANLIKLLQLLKPKVRNAWLLHHYLLVLRVSCSLLTDKLPGLPDHQSVMDCSRSPPQVLVPLMNADIDQEGPLSEYVFDRGSVEEARQKLRKSGLPTRLEMPAHPGESLAIAL